MRVEVLMGRVYRNPPVTEALCEFHIDPGSPWDVTIFGDYYHRVQADFPEKRQRPQVEMAVQQREGGMIGELRDRGIRMRFLRSDHSALLQLAPHLLVVNKLQPYTSWEEFREMIQARLDDYRAVVDVMPLDRIVLRYINRFECPAEGFSVGAVFNASEFLPARLMQAEAPFFTRLEMPQEPGYRLALTMGTVESSNPDQVAVLLDLASLVTETSVLEEPVLASTLDKAHDQIEQVFESCLTDVWREKFDREV
jgi:uncharacterized protein (TIGR04255 family)